MGPSRTFCATDCQDNGAIYEGNSKLFIYGIDTINVKNPCLEVEPGSGSLSPVVTHIDNQGSVHDVFNTAVVAAYMRQSA